ncbi:hypothetical protein K1719_025823 [Acacia pycnantha]|nr:hypothetical protein K1719_025823 [Acacia pycnantha]
MDDDFPILPLEIILNILKRLPVKSLMRFQCVCRGWKILFKTQSFITDHLNHSNHQNPCLLMKDFHLDDLSNMHCLNSEMQIWELQNPPLISYLKQGSWKEEKFRLNGFGDVTSRGVTVNGVMFWWSYKTVGKDDDDKRLIVSFDLAVEVFTLIPTPQLHDAYGLTMYEEKLAIFSWIEDSKHSVIDLWVMEDGVGLFGEMKLSAFLSGKVFSSNNLLFPFLPAWLPGMCGSLPSIAMTDMDMDGSNPLLPQDVITNILIRLPEDDGRVSQVKVYSLSVGSWKDVQFGNLDGVGILSSNGFSFNGAIFWIGYKKGLEEDEDELGWIVSFDIAMEVFALIPMTFSLFSNANTSYLTAYENKLALLSHTLSGDLKSSLIHLWVMEEGTCGSRERWVWTKKYISSPYLGYFLVPVAIWRNEIVCIVASPLSDTIDKIEDDERKPVLLNLTTNEFKASDICKAVLGYGIFNYSESLVPVGNIHTE